VHTRVEHGFNPSMDWIGSGFSGSGPGTNLKVGGTGPERKWGGAPIRREVPIKKIFGRAPPLFGSKSTNSRFGELFRDGQYSLVSFLFVVLLLTVPRVPSCL